MNVRALAKALSVFYDTLIDEEDFTHRSAFDLCVVALPVFAEDTEAIEGMDSL